MAEAFAANGTDVALVGPATVTSTTAGWHEVWELVATPCHSHLAVRSQAISWLRTLAGHLERIEANAGRGPVLVFLSYLDLFLGRWLVPFDWLRIVGQRRFSGLIFHGEAGEGLRHRKWRRGPLASFALLYSRLCPAIASLNEGGAPGLANLLSPKPVLVFPDVAREPFNTSASNSPLLQQIRFCARGRPILVLLGALAWRKGLQEFLQLANLLPVESWFLVCAGRVFDHSATQEGAGLLARARADTQEHLLLCDRWLTDAEFDAILQASTAVFAVYRDWRSSSNLLTKAAQAEKPVLVSEGGLMAERVKRYGTGLAAPENNVSIMADILTSGKLQTLASTPEFSRGCVRYRTDHNVERLHQMVGTLLKACRVPRI